MKRRLLDAVNARAAERMTELEATEHESAMNTLDSVLVYLSAQYREHHINGNHLRARDYDDAHTIVLNCAQCADWTERILARLFERYQAEIAIDPNGSTPYPQAIFDAGQLVFEANN